MPFFSTTWTEKEAYLQGYHSVAGIDEVGRGSLAGPVVAAAIIFPLPLPDFLPPEIRDSKRLSPQQRERLFPKIVKMARAIGVGVVSQKEIDQINIHQASLKAMKMAVANLKSPVDYLLVDGTFPLTLPLPQSILKKGDNISTSVASASILAKVIRDQIMVGCHRLFPPYNFAQNKGYGTAEHLRALERYGFCPLHRKTFKGVKELSLA